MAHRGGLNMRTIDDQPADKLKAAGRLDGARGHMLMPSAVKSKIPRMRAQEDVDDPVVYAKFFSPYSGAVWLITEFDGNDEMFGWADLGFGMGELGYISLRELENSNKQGLPLVERDTSFRPMPLSKAKRQNRNASLTKKAKLVRIAMKRAKADPEFRRKLVAHLKTAKFPPKAVDVNRLKDTDGFWKAKNTDISRAGGVQPLTNPKDVADVIFWLNMVAMAWEDQHR